MSFCKRLGQLAELAQRNLVLNNHIFFQNIPQLSDMLGNNRKFFSAEEGNIHSLINQYNAFKESVINPDKNLSKETLDAKNSIYNTDLNNMFKALGNGTTLIIDGNKRVLSSQDLLRNRETVQEYVLNHSDFAKGLTTDVQKAQIVDIVWGIRELLARGGYSIEKQFKILSYGDAVETLLSDMGISLKIDFAEALQETPKHITQEDFMRSASTFLDMMCEENGIIASKEAKQRMLQDTLNIGSMYPDMLAKAKGLINNTRAVYNPLKYTWGVVSSGILLVSSAVFGSSIYLARKKTLSVLEDHKFIDYLLENENILKSEGRVKNYPDITMETGAPYMHRFIDKVMGDTSRLGELMKNGWHQIYDMGMDNWIKRQSLAQALSKWGLTDRDLDNLLVQVQKGDKLADNFLKDITSYATQQYSSFFTNSRLQAFSRNKFSRGWWIAVNAQQSYMMQRSIEVTNALWKLGHDLQNGKLKTWGDFYDYLYKPENQELLSLLATIPICGRFGTYLSGDFDRNADEEESTTYSMLMNDYYSVFTQNMVARMFSNFFEYTGAYNQYVDETGQEHSYIKGVEAGAYGLIKGIVSGLFREFNTFNPLIAPMSAAANGMPDLVVASFLTEMNKLSNGLGRFNLLPGLDTYSQQVIPDARDIFGLSIMELQKLNPSLRDTAKLHSMEDVSKFLNGEQPGLLSTMNLLRNLPVVKWLISSSEDTSFNSKFNEPVYKKMLEDIDTDPVLINLMNGKWDNTMLRTPEDIKNAYNILSEMDLTKGQTNSEMQKELTSWGMKDMKLDTFMQVLSQKMGDKYLTQKLQQAVDGGYLSTNKSDLLTIMAFADAQVNGSSRLVLSYVANKELDAIKQQMNIARGVPPKSAKYEELPSEYYTQAQAAVLEKYMPFMYQADKTSWFALMDSRLKQLHPNWARSQKSGTSLSQFLNANMFMDMVMYDESKKSNVNSNYIKSVYSFIGKYAPDDKTRMALYEMSMNSVDNMHLDRNVANQVKLGVVLGNVDHLNTMLKDKNFVENNKDVIQRALDITYGFVDGLNRTGREYATEGLSGTARKQAVYSGKGYSPQSYQRGNASATKQLEDTKLPSVRANTPSWYSPKSTVRYPYNPQSKSQTLYNDKETQWYITVKN